MISDYGFKNRNFDCFKVLKCEAKWEVGVVLCETILNFGLIGRDYNSFRMCLLVSFFFNWFLYLFQILWVRGFVQSENNSYLFQIRLKFIVLGSLAIPASTMVNLIFVLSRDWWFVGAQPASLLMDNRVFPSPRNIFIYEL